MLELVIRSSASATDGPSASHCLTSRRTSCVTHSQTRQIHCCSPDGKHKETKLAWLKKKGKMMNVTVSDGLEVIPHGHMTNKDLTWSCYITQGCIWAEPSQNKDLPLTLTVEICLRAGKQWYVWLWCQTAQSSATTTENLKDRDVITNNPQQPRVQPLTASVVTVLGLL